MRRPAPLSWLLVIAVAAAPLLGGCASGHHRRPRTLGFAGAGLALGGSAVWVAGEQRSNPGNVPTIGFGIVAAGIAAMVAAGAWMAAEAACQADPDCDDSEECREIPAPPGGVPYKQCMPR